MSCLRNLMMYLFTFSKYENPTKNQRQTGKLTSQVPKFDRCWTNLFYFPQCHTMLFIFQKDQTNKISQKHKPVNYFCAEDLRRSSIKV